MNGSFRQKVLHVVSMIPKGTVLTYAAVAERAGYPGAARAVGTVMRLNHDESVPCHRVIRSDGSLGQYNRGDGRKRELLQEEGAI